MENRPFNQLPQIEQLLQEPTVTEWFSTLSRPLVAKIASEVVADERRRIRDGKSAPQYGDIVSAVDDRCRALHKKRLRRVINATGVVNHTNLGRAPIPPAVWNAAESVNTGYSNLELNLETGRRGRRNGIIPDLLSVLVGSEAGLIVNNCAAAVFLMLTALASGREVIVSRGEQVQIGGGFRIPEILRLSGARLVEVGTTNITTAADYAAAVTDDTAMVLVVHTSNFEIRGFTERPEVSDIRAVLPKHVILAVDQGSGVTTEAIPGEIRVGAHLKAGADVVSFSGDKVLGGPQAGFIVGRKELVDTMDRHPFSRTVRTGKTVRALTEELLVRKVAGADVGAVASALSTDISALKRRGRSMLRGLGGRVRLVPSEATVGGGSAPGQTFESVALELSSGQPANILIEELRAWDPPIIGTITDGSVRLDLATLRDTEVKVVVSAIRSIMGAE